MTDFRKTLEDMAAGLECAQEAEQHVMAGLAHYLDVPGIDRTPNDYRRITVYLEAKNNEARFRREAEAIRMTLELLK